MKPTDENPEPPGFASQADLEKMNPQEQQAVIEHDRRLAQEYDAQRPRDWSSPTNSVWGPMWL